MSYTCIVKENKIRTQIANFTMVFVWTYGSTSPLCKQSWSMLSTMQLISCSPSLAPFEPQPPATFISSIGPDPFGSLRSPLTKLKNLQYNEYNQHATAGLGRPTKIFTYQISPNFVSFQICQLPPFSATLTSSCHLRRLGMPKSYEN